MAKGRAAGRVAAAAAACALVAGAAGAAGSRGGVDRLDLRLGRPDAEGRVRATVRCEGRGTIARRAYDPVVDRLCVMVGSAGVLRLGEVEGDIRGKVNAAGTWRVKAARPYGPGSSVRMTFNPSEGTYEFRAKGVDATRLAQGDATGERFVFWAGPLYHAEDVDLLAAGATRLYLLPEGVDRPQRGNPSYDTGTPWIPAADIDPPEQVVEVDEWQWMDAGDPPAPAGPW
jgi:hypothetical protein